MKIVQEMGYNVRLFLLLAGLFPATSCLGMRYDTYEWLLMLHIAGINHSTTLPSPTLTIQNLHNNSVVETGFIIGTASASGSVTRVEVSLDGGAYTTATGTDSWSYQLPVGPATWRDGTQHTIAVRSVDSEGNHSEAGTIHVRKGNNKDINGDGYADLVVGGPGYGPDAAGRVYLFYSGGIDRMSATTASDADSFITGEADNFFGTTANLGDVNGDGFADLVVDTYWSGRVYLFYSDGTNGISATTVNEANSSITGLPNSGFRRSVSLGDVNGDGYNDLVVAPYSDRVYLFYSDGISGITTTLAANANTIIIGESGFGSSVSQGDVNGDGYTDLVVGATSSDRVYLFYSEGTNGISATAATDADITITGESGTLFGSSVNFGDVNGDGYLDLAISAPGYNSGIGRVYLFYSEGASGISATTASTDANTSITGVISNSSSCSMSYGDVNGDGFSDLAIASFDYSPDGGHVYLFHSAGIGGISATIFTEADAIITGTVPRPGEFNVACMWVAGLGDVNGDNYADLAIATSWYSMATGQVYLFHSLGTSGITTTTTADATITGEASPNLFGYSIGK